MRRKTLITLWFVWFAKEKLNPVRLAKNRLIIQRLCMMVIALNVVDPFVKMRGICVVK